MGRAMPDSTPETAILYQNPSRTVILIDIPTSIAQAQTTPGYPTYDTLVSCEPVRQPYPSTEPKSEAARTKVLQRAHPEALAIHSLLRKQIQDALAEIRAAHKGDWCLPRFLSQLKIREPRLTKDKFASSTPSYPKPAEAHGGRPSQLGLGMCGETASLSVSTPQRPIQLRDASSGLPISHVDMRSICNCVVRSDYNNPLTFDIDSAYQLRIPPLSTFVRGPLETSVETFMNAAKRYLRNDSLSGSGQFDFILADPPWSNRSVRRSKKYKTLEHPSNDVWKTVLDVLDKYLAPGGLVAIWVTNKAEPREKVLKAFQRCNVQLMEEWVWIKTTLHGDLVTDLDGVWRRPYEILLLGRKSHGRGSASLVAQPSAISRRFICAVPDLHSRKPSVKELIEPLMPDRYSYRALELFARNLTAGWWSWGDEVLKFNWEENWVEEGLRPTTQG